VNWRETFDALCDRKMREADAEAIAPLETIEEHDLWPAARRIGSEWTRALYGGDAVLAPEPADRPAVSLVFVQTRDGNTGAADPAELGGGPTDMHLIYEGLSRVAADAVLAGAGSARGHRSFFSVWRRELIALREELGLPRHPAQIVASRDGRLDVRSALLFNVPAVLRCSLLHTWSWNRRAPNPASTNSTSGGGSWRTSRCRPAAASSTFRTSSGSDVCDT